MDEVNKGLLALPGPIKGIDDIDVNPAMETPAGDPVSECYRPRVWLGHAQRSGDSLNGCFKSLPPKDTSVGFRSGNMKNFRS